MQEIQVRRPDGNIYTADKLRDGPALIIEEGGRPFVGVDQEQWLKLFDYLEAHGLAERMVTEEKHDAFEGFKEGWMQLQRGEGFPYEELWERAEQ